MVLPYLRDRGSVVDAYALITTFGDDAGFEAAARAEQSRERGNIVKFCHWRQIERLIALLADPETHGTIH